MKASGKLRPVSVLSEIGSSVDEIKSTRSSRRSSINREDKFLHVTESTTTEIDALFRPNDIYSCIRPLVYFYQMFGFVCFTYVRRTNARSLYHISRYGCVYSASLVICLALMSVFIEKSFAGVVYVTKNAVTVFDDHLQMHGPMFLAVVAMVSAQYQRDIITCIDRLAEVDAKLKLFGVVIPHRKNQTFLITFLTSGIVILFVYIIIDTILFDIDNIYFPAMYWVGYILPKFLNWIASTIFLSWVLALRQRLEFINILILESAHQDFELIRTLPDLHATICTIAKTINGVHSFQLLAMVTILFWDIIASIYFLLKELFLLIDGKETLEGTIYFEAYWILWYVSVTLVLCSSCSSVKNEAKLSGDYVHKAHRKTYDSAIIDELQLFSSQLLHSKISFSACGFFSLGMPLVCSMVGAVTTYLVILVQFDMVVTTSSAEAKV